jgi:hypothetical protein
MKNKKWLNCKFTKKFLYLVPTLTFLFIMPRTLLATPSADFLYNETNLGGGLWQYDYTLHNTSDPVADAGSEIYYLFFTFDSSSIFINLTNPIGWDSIDGIDFHETFSLNPGADPVGTDIAPGSFLGGFSFQISYQIGSLPFELFFANPSDPNNPVQYSGVSASLVSPVPETSTLFMLGIGLMLLIFSKSYRQCNAKKILKN